MRTTSVRLPEEYMEEITEPKGISELMRNKNIVDTRNILDEEQWKEAGFSVKMLGMGDYEKA